VSEKYRFSRNRYFNEVDLAKNEYNNNHFKTLANEATSNPKKWWSLVKNVLGVNNTNKENNIPTMIHEGVPYVTDESKAYLFNKSFLQSSSLPSPPPHLPPMNQNPDLNCHLEDITVTEEDVNDILKILDTTKAYGPDNISPRLLKEARPSIVNILTQIFNKSLQLCSFPDIWKRANVLPIFKKAEEFITTNYRPISLLSILAKVFERIVFKYLFNYFKENFLLSIWQSGFIPGSSTVTQLVEIYNEFCKAIDNGKEIRVVFLDISKAFDRVWHKGLLHKLEKAGIKGKLLLWLEDYLKCRQQRVLINGTFSAWAFITAGISPWPPSIPHLHK